MPPKKNKKGIHRIFQVRTSSLSTTMASSNNNNNKSSSSTTTTITSTSLAHEILLEQNQMLREQSQMLREENQTLRDENELLKKDWMPKPTGDAALYFVEVSSMILSESNANQSNHRQKQIQEEEEEEKKQQLKRKKMKKKEIKRIGKILGLTYLELIHCKQDAITTTCRKVVKTIYPDCESRAKQHVSTMSSAKIHAIRCKCAILETRIDIRSKRVQTNIGEYWGASKEHYDSAKEI